MNEPLRFRAHAMVLAQLALLASTACGRSGEPEPRPASTTPATASPATTPLAPPSATTAPSAAPSPQAALGAECRTDADCAPLYCELNFDGSKFLDTPGRCVKARPIYEGRPLRVDGAVHLADAGTAWHGEDARAEQRATAAAMSAEERARWAEHLRDSAFEEHASIAAFARTLCELLALGAPLWLLEDTQRALGDEIQHASASFAWASALADRPLGPGRLEAASAPFAPTGLRGVALLRDIFHGGCLGETSAVEQALRHAEQASQPALAAFFTRIAADEARHAALAFRSVAWLASGEPTCADALVEELEQLGRDDPAALARVLPLLHEAGVRCTPQPGASHDHAAALHHA